MDTDTRQSKISLYTLQLWSSCLRRPQRRRDGIGTDRVDRLPQLRFRTLSEDTRDQRGILEEAARMLGWYEEEVQRCLIL
jgi:hypothetical protein